MKKLKILLIISIFMSSVNLFTSCVSTPNEQEVEKLFLLARQSEDTGRYFLNTKNGQVVLVKDVYFRKQRIGDVRRDIIYEFQDDKGKIHKLSMLRFHIKHKKMVKR